MDIDRLIDGKELTCEYMVESGPDSSPGRPAITGGPPDMWSPPEDGEMTISAVSQREKGSESEWVSVGLDDFLSAVAQSEGLADDIPLNSMWPVTAKSKAEDIVIQILLDAMDDKIRNEEEDASLQRAENRADALLDKEWS